ncbi:alkylhydroperoxidase [Variovorax sp. KBW07]|uniref:carboxymuconolactone decarboxylase family protein n=1 Tax=Variovorax sp. KBW07 TaxID=2153358 RepID=UPI000F5685E9|nr:carboxymuconolactone decarboxylase family protein [Variovorax sp. KBW07]RQO45128.1 alkylhydroperoxidase [Variovorax sp. KBW07]
MQARLDYHKASPDAVKALIALEVALARRGLDKNLVNLVNLRISQINGCAYCIDLHTADLRKAGETDRRLATVSIWQDTPFFTERERAALAWAEAVTQVSLTHVPDAAYEALRAQFSETEQVDLTMAICAMNSWNRLSIAFRKTLTA